MEIEIAQRSVLKAKIYGKEYALKKPTLGEVEDMQEKYEKIDSTKEKSALMRSFLAQLGLPENDSKAMELDHFLLIVEALTSSKKK